MSSNMNLLVVNRGSSSIKCSLYRFSQKPEHFSAPFWEAKQEASLHENTEKLLDLLLEPLWKRIAQEEIDLIAHRVVHGGRKYRETVLIDDAVEKEIEHLAELAPLHNLANLQGIKSLRKRFPNKRHVAVFDTAFHHTLSQKAKVYPGPYRWYEEGIERFGFHGISFQYCARRALQVLNGSQENTKLIVCHLGSGASLCAVKEGKSIDTTMGFTPLEGVMMDTRSGTIDPGILLYLLQEKKISCDAIYHDLYHNSGLLGISGASEDMRIILKKASEGDERSQLALDLYIHRLNACLGSMIASLQGVDAVIFTGGIGENAPLIRERVCSNFSFLNVDLDLTQNALATHEDRILSNPSSKVRVLLIHTQEAFEIARECTLKFL